MRRIFHGLLVALALVLPISSASACLWDSEVNRAEREFKSKYEKPASPSEAPSSLESDTKDRLLTLGGGAGLVLLASAMMIVLRRPRN